MTPEDFRQPGTVYQLGLPPNRIDILTQQSGVDFDEAARDTVPGHLGSEPVRCIGLDVMIRTKHASGRAKDVADAATLEEIRNDAEALLQLAPCALDRGRGVAGRHPSATHPPADPAA